MNESSRLRSAGFCRRSLLRSFLLVVFGIATTGMNMSGGRLAAAEGKATKESVDYRDTAQGPSLCGNCKYFKKPSSCSIVEGDIAPTGWCSKYAR